MTTKAATSVAYEHQGVNESNNAKIKAVAPVLADNDVLTIALPAGMDPGYVPQALPTVYTEDVNGVFTLTNPFDAIVMDSKAGTMSLTSNGGSAAGAVVLIVLGPSF